MSPELVLVDPALAAAARAALPPRPEFAPMHAPAIEVRRHTTPTECRRPRPTEGSRKTARRKIAAVAIIGMIAAATYAVVIGAFERQSGTTSTGRSSVPRSADPLRRVTAAPLRTAIAIAADRTRSTEDAKSQSRRHEQPRARPRTADLQPVPAKDSRTFAWAEARESSAYEFQLFRGSVLVFRARTSKARLVLPPTWRNAGTHRRLRPGSYRWYVWPVPRGTTRPLAQAVVQAKLVIKP
jgi:hypothetical protein